MSVILLLKTLLSKQPWQFIQNNYYRVQLDNKQANKYQFRSQPATPSFWIANCQVHITTLLAVLFQQPITKQ